MRAFAISLIGINHNLLYREQNGTGANTNCNKILYSIVFRLNEGGAVVHNLHNL